MLWHIVQRVSCSPLWRKVVACYCLVALSLAGVTLCFCAHEGECEEDSAHPVACEEVCLCAETAHDHITMEVQSAVFVVKTFRVIPVFSSGDFTHTRSVNLGENRASAPFRERECDDNHVIALVKLTRRLC